MHEHDRADEGPGEGNLAEFYQQHREQQSGDEMEADAAADLELADSSVDVGERLAEAREVAGDTVEELGSRLGVAAPTVKSWEAGEATPPSNVLARAAGVLGVSPSWLLLGHGDEPVEVDPELAHIRETLADVRESLRSAEAQLASLTDRLNDVA